MANPFELLVANLNSLGFFGFLLPFILVFALVFALLLKSKGLGEDKKIIAVISLVVGFFVIGFGGVPLAQFFTSLFGFGSLILAGILVILLFAAMSGVDVAKWGSSKSLWAVVIGLGVIIFAIALGSFGIVVNQSSVAIVFVIVILAIAVGYITK